jgi:4-hydroxybenzoate polyprenyltransferase
MNLMPILKFLRVSALPSALADVFGGMALVTALAMATGGFELTTLPLVGVLLATVGVYLLGMALNDLLHHRKDKALGKARPLVTGELTLLRGWVVAFCLYVLALIGARLAEIDLYVFALMALVLLYNWLAAGRVKEGKLLATPIRSVLSVPVIALCRALHVSLPVFAFGRPEMLEQPLFWLFVGSVFVYFCLVTTISLFEDLGGGRRALQGVQWGLAVPVLVVPLYWYGQPGQPTDWLIGGALALVVLGYLLVTLHMVIGSAVRDPVPPKLGRAVGTGIRGEALLMGGFALALAQDQPWWGLLAIFCFPLGKFLSRFVSPT